MTDTDWTALRGANYVPSYARDQVEMWLTRFDAEILTREVRFAKGLGLEALRVFLSFDAYLLDGPRYLGNLQRFFDDCRNQEIRLLVVVFDSCGTDRNDPREVWLPLRQACQRVVAEDAQVVGWPQERELLLASLDGPAFPGDLEVPYSGDPLVLFSEGWRRSPGNLRLGEDWRPKVRSYLEALVARFGAHPALLAWDVMNEPLLANFSEKRGEVLPFLKWAVETLVELKPSAPLTVGCIYPEEMEQYDALTGGALGLLSCHSYDHGQKLDGYLAKAQAVAARLGKPWLLTECGNFEHPGNPELQTDEGQDRIWADLLPRLTRARVGWFATHLIMGYGPFLSLALLCPNGTRRPAAHRVAKWLAEHDGRPVALRAEGPLSGGRSTLLPEEAS